MTPPPAIDLGPLEDLVGYQLRRAFLRSNQLFGRLAAGAGLAPGQYGVLKLIALNPGRSQSDMAAAAGLDRSSLTQMLDLLTGHGWVERRSGPDRRTLSLWLTQAGDTAIAAAEPLVAEHEVAIRGGMSEEDANRLLGLLMRLAITV